MSADRFADADQHERFRAALRLLDVDLKERFAGESWTLPVRRNVEGYVACWLAEHGYAFSCHAVKRGLGDHPWLPGVKVAIQLVPLDATAAQLLAASGALSPPAALGAPPPEERPAPSVPAVERGRKVLLPPLDAEEIDALYSALAVSWAETGRYDHTSAYLERALRRALRESRGEDHVA